MDRGVIGTATRCKGSRLARQGRCTQKCTAEIQQSKRGCMSNRWITTILTNAEVTGQTRAVLFLLAYHANDEGRSWPTKVTLARECKASRRTIYTALDALVASGWVVIEGRNFILQDRVT